MTWAAGLGAGAHFLEPPGAASRPSPSSLGRPVSPLRSSQKVVTAAEATATFRLLPGGGGGGPVRSALCSDAN